MTGDPFPKMVYARPDLLCPGCGKPDWCRVSPDRLACLCRRESSGAKKAYSESGPWLHIFRQGETRPVYVPPPKPVKELSGIDWQAEAMKYAAAIHPLALGELSVKLGMPPTALNAIALAGWKDDWRCFTFPERDGDGVVIGLGTRHTDGAKKFLKGAMRGLTLPKGWDGPGETLWVVEGPTDAAAMTAAGLRAVARPSNIGGGRHLTKLLEFVPAERRVVVVGEDDRKPDGLWPGLTGCTAVARELAKSCRQPIFWALPPEGHKDARAYLTHSNHGEAKWADRGRDWAYSVTLHPADLTADQYKADVVLADEAFDFDVTAWVPDYVIDRAIPRTEDADLSALFQ